MELAAYHRQLEALFNGPVYGLSQTEKNTQLVALAKNLHRHHLDNSEHYRALFQDSQEITTLADMPYVAVRLFKLLTLQSISDEQVFRLLASSGTTGQTPAKVVLDRDTSARQSKALVKIMQEFIGKQRLPMLIIDSPSILNNPTLSARAAGIQGMAFFGRKPVYALNEDMSVNIEAVKAFSDAHRDGPVLLFGFTFMVWLHFIEGLAQAGEQLALPNGILIHSGGWKKLVDREVDNTTFKQGVLAQTGISRVHNFYGMAEQVGSVFVECEQGHLHAPSLADVIIRSPYTLEPVATGEQGLIQVISALPTSYPGHSLLTEDLGRVIGIDNCSCGRKGTYFSVEGRLPKTEIRGCSDTAGQV